MRAIVVLFLSVLIGCSRQDATGRLAAADTTDQPELTSGERRASIALKGEAAATLRSGPQVPISLPSGFSVYPGATVISNTVVHRSGARQVLVVFEARAPVDAVMRHYRTQARGAGATLTLDLGGDERASIGGRLASGETLAISARRSDGITRVEFAQG